MTRWRHPRCLDDAFYEPPSPGSTTIGLIGGGIPSPIDPRAVPDATLDVVIEHRLQLDRCRYTL